MAKEKLPKRAEVTITKEFSLSTRWFLHHKTWHVHVSSIYANVLVSPQGFHLDLQVW